MPFSEWKKVRLNLAFLISAGSLRQPPPKEEGQDQRKINIDAKLLYF